MKIMSMVKNFYNTMCYKNELGNSILNLITNKGALRHLMLGAVYQGCVMIVLSVVLGGMFAFYGCEKETIDEERTIAIDTLNIIESNTEGVLIDSLQLKESNTKSPVQLLMRSLVSETLELKISPALNTGIHNHLKSISAMSGDIMEITFMDLAAQAITNLKLDEMNSSTDTMIYVGSQLAVYNGKSTSLRYFLYLGKEIENSLIIKKEVMGNGEWWKREKMEFTINYDNNRITEKQIMPNGEKILVYEYSKISESSITRKNLIDYTYDLIAEVEILEKQ